MIPLRSGGLRQRAGAPHRSGWMSGIKGMGGTPAQGEPTERQPLVPAVEDGRPESFARRAGRKPRLSQIQSRCTRPCVKARGSMASARIPPIGATSWASSHGGSDSCITAERPAAWRHRRLSSGGIMAIQHGAIGRSLHGIWDAGGRWISASGSGPERDTACSMKRTLLPD